MTKVCKGGHNQSTTGRDDTSKCTMNNVFTKGQIKYSNKNVVYMPSNLSDSQLASVGLCTRRPDRFEMCPPGFSVLENIPSHTTSAGRPRGRPRGRPKGSRKATGDRCSQVKVSRADTTHRRKATQRKPRCMELQGKADILGKSVHEYSESNYSLYIVI